MDRYTRRLSQGVGPGYTRLRIAPYVARRGVGKRTRGRRVVAKSCDAERTWACIVCMICVGSAVWLAPSHVAAQPLPIDWQAPPGCPSLADVSSWLEAVVPAELRTRLAGITAEVHITRVERRYHAAIRVTHGSWSGEREVDGRRCEEV